MIARSNSSPRTSSVIRKSARSSWRENARLSYQAICEQWGCTGQDLLDILSREHQQAEMLQTSGLSDADIAELAGSGRSSEDSDDIAFYDKQDGDET